MFPHLRAKILQMEKLNIRGLVKSWCQHAACTIHADNCLKSGHFDTVQEFVRLVCINAFNTNKQPRGRSKRASLTSSPPVSPRTLGAETQTSGPAEPEGSFRESIVFDDVVRDECGTKILHFRLQFHKVLSKFVEFSL